MSENEKKNINIIDVVDKFIKNDDVKFFHLLRNGQATGKNGKKPARAMFTIPEDICNETNGNLKALENWVFIAMAIPKQKVSQFVNKYAKEKLNKGDEKEL